MSELGIATAAPDKIVLAVVSHLNEGNIEDAVAFFADEFSFEDHGTDWSSPRRTDWQNFFGRRTNSTRTPYYKLKGYL